MDKSDVLREFGKRIRIAREAIPGMSQEELGEAIGTTKSAISSYENGKTDPRYSLVQSMADALKVSFTWLATGKNVIEVDKDPVKAQCIKDYISYLEHKQKMEEGK